MIRTTTNREQSNRLVHGKKQHATVRIDAYNSELKHAEGFLGDRANNAAFRSRLDDWRERLGEVGDNPLGDRPAREFSKKKLDQILIRGDAEAAGLVHGALEEFAQELAQVSHRLLLLKSWQQTEAIVVGGGFRGSRIGEIAIGRAAVLLKAKHGHALTFRPIRHDPDEAGLIGNIHLIPAQLFDRYDSMLGVDIGGSNIRSGLIELNIRGDGDFCDAHVCVSHQWRYADEKLTRDQAVEGLAEMIQKLIREADHRDLRIAPFLGIGCPGVIAKDGSIEKGAQNLPGNWESSRFNLPQTIRDHIPTIGKHSTVIMLHNDAVVQGLSETPWMTDVKRWGVLTIGTGLGNARFTNCSPRKEKRAR